MRKEATSARASLKANEPYAWNTCVEDGIRYTQVDFTVWLLEYRLGCHDLFWIQYPSMNWWDKLEYHTHYVASHVLPRGHVVPEVGTRTCQSLVKRPTVRADAYHCIIRLHV